MADAAAAVARALLYEGFALYPYRASALKNRQRYFFGGVYPPAWARANPGDRDSTGAQLLVQGFDLTEISVTVRFLQFEVDGGASERSIEMPGCRLGDLVANPRSRAFDLCVLSLAAHRIDDLYRVDLQVSNTSTSVPLTREEALPTTMASLHAALQVRDGEWISLLEPAAIHAAAAKSCSHDGLYPVLVGRDGARDTMLASPIVLYDYPRIAPESPGDLFDGTEMDEMLTLRLQTLAPSEVDELSRAEPRVRELLQRAQTLAPDRMSDLHGALRTTGSPIGKGSKVRIKPRTGGDVFDLALAGRAATVTAVERDFDGAVHIAVVIDDDPGADLGEAGFHGHRFFFRPTEVELL